jgi:hypothetical protein
MAGRIRTIGKSNYLIGNRIRNLSSCSIVPQPATLPRVPDKERVHIHAYIYSCVFAQSKNCGDRETAVTRLWPIHKQQTVGAT